jgi:hypothetical protein
MQRNDMGVEFWHGVFQWGSVVLVALTFVFVAGALWTGNAIRERQAIRLEQLETEIGSARTASRSQLSPAFAPPAPDVPARVPPRTLDQSERATLLDALRTGRPDGPVAIRFVSGSSTEPADFARALADVIEEAGWTLNDGDSSGPTMGTPPVGLLVRVSDRGEVPRRAAALQEALNRAALGATIERLPDLRDGAVELMVGLRP